MPRNDDKLFDSLDHSEIDALVDGISNACGTADSGPITPIIIGPVKVVIASRRRLDKLLITDQDYIDDVLREVKSNCSNPREIKSFMKAREQMQYLNAPYAFATNLQEAVEYAGLFQPPIIVAYNLITDSRVGRKELHLRITSIYNNIPRDSLLAYYPQLSGSAEGRQSTTLVIIEPKLTGKVIDQFRLHTSTAYGQVIRKIMKKNPANVKLFGYPDLGSVVQLVNEMMESANGKNGTNGANGSSYGK
ncbi:hypothetical protein COV19_04015 [Candidatus Woesearchaeota archaeon CG10_big_fil_rev_8_21_14_0_10_44_13]|nr:MAG: hypothetical protein COV19_04015 [Candidatus Woesearchaeota archaeon CG10_big_fil_rev_8_21_14_0_10_44_13]